jgi:hypothetical protein
VTQRDRIMLFAVALVAVVAATFMLAIKPKREEAARLADQVAEAETRRDNALAQLANAKQARARFTEAQIGIARLGKAVPPDEDTATIVYQLERTARAAGIDFRSLRIEPGGENPTPSSGAGSDNPDGKSGNVAKVPVKLAFEGEFFQLRRFLDHMTSFTRMRDGKYVSARGRLFSVDGVSLTAGRGGFPSIVAKINAVAYTAPAPSTSTAPTGGGTGTTEQAGGTTTASTTTETATR